MAVAHIRQRDTGNREQVAHEDISGATQAQTKVTPQTRNEVSSEPASEPARQSTAPVTVERAADQERQSAQGQQQRPVNENAARSDEQKREESRNQKAAGMQAQARQPRQQDAGEQRPAASSSQTQPPVVNAQDIADDKARRTSADILNDIVPFSSGFTQPFDDSMMQSAKEQAVQLHEQRRQEERQARKTLKAAEPYSSEYGAANQIIEAAKERKDRKRVKRELVSEFDSESRRPQLERASTVVKNPEMTRKKRANVKVSFQNYSYGVHVYDKMISDATLKFDEVGIGFTCLRELIGQNPEYLNSVLQDALQERGVSSVTDLSISAVVDLVNEVRPEVAVFKSPDNQGPDIQRRRLVIVTSDDRGVFMHPLMAALFTADFDGDDATVSLDEEAIQMSEPAMRWLVDPNGNLMMDIDWLPHPMITDTETLSAREFARSVMLGKYGGDASTIVDGIIDLSDSNMIVDDGDREDMQTDAWKKIVQGAFELANGSKFSVSDILTDVYDNLHRMQVDYILHTMGEYVTPENMPEPSVPGDYMVLDVLEDMTTGRWDGNAQELRVRLLSFPGDVKKKNAPFRFTSDLGKLIGWDNRSQIGYAEIDLYDEEQLDKFYKSMMQYVEARRMSRESNEVGKKVNAHRLLKDRVRARVGMPKNHKSFAVWLAKFARVYAAEAARINMANIAFTSDMGLISESIVKEIPQQLDKISYIDLVSALIEIYPDVTIGDMFHNIGYRLGTRVNRYGKIIGKASAFFDSAYVEGDTGYRNRRENPDGKIAYLRAKYEHMQLNTFAAFNDIIRWQDRSSVGQRVRNTVFDADGNIDLNHIDSSVSDVNNALEFQILQAIAYRSASDAYEYGKLVYGLNESSPHASEKPSMTEMMRSCVRTIHEEGEKGANSDEMVSILGYTGIDMMADLNCHSTAGFVNSIYYKKMVEHLADMDKFNNVRLCMVYDWKMSSITRTMDDMVLLDSTDAEDLYRMMQLMNKIEFAYQELSESSPVWKSIVTEIKTNRAFAELKENKGFQDGIIEEKSLPPLAREYWQNPKHDNIIELMTDLDIGFNEKLNVLVDIVKYHTHNNDIKPAQIAYQLELGAESTSVFSGNGKKSVYTVYQDFAGEYDKYRRKSESNMFEELGRAEEHEVEYLPMLRAMASKPWLMTHVDDGTYVDAINAVYDKNHAQTSKSKQHQWTNAAYQALVYQHNGGFYDDLYRTGDRVLGLKHIDTISPSEIVRLLGDPGFSMTVYDNMGRIIELTGSRLLGKEDGYVPNETDIRDYLLANPKVSTYIKMHAVCVTKGVSSSAYLAAYRGLPETAEECRNTQDGLDAMKYYMRDCPVYGGLISLLSGSRYNTRNSRRRLAYLENVVCWSIHDIMVKFGGGGIDLDSMTRNELVSLCRKYGMKGISKYNKSQLKDALGAQNFNFGTHVLANFHVHGPDVLANSLISGWDKLVKKDPLLDSIAASDQERMDIAQDLYDKLCEALDSKIRSLFEIDERHLDAIMNRFCIHLDSVELFITPESVMSFVDVVQELNGAKTEMDTGIQGSETQKYANFAALVAPRDRYADLAAIEDMVDGSFNGCAVSTGDVIVVNEDGSSNVHEILDKDMNAVIEVPEGFHVPDRSVDTYGNPVNSISRYMVSKRSNGAEALNLKAKKFGIDIADNSIIKMQSAFGDSTYQELVDEYQRIADTEGWFAAKLSLAKMLMKENEKIGYKDLTLANYMCLADVMLKQDENGKVVLRSLEQLYIACKYRIGADAQNSTVAENMEAVASIRDDLSENGVGVSEGFVEDVIDSLSPKSSYVNFSARRERSSDFTVNATMLQTIQKSTGARVPTSSELETSNRVVLFGHGKKDPHGIFEYIVNVPAARGYKFIGGAGRDIRKEYQVQYNLCGPKCAFWIGADVSSERALEISRWAYTHGITLFFQDSANIPVELTKDSIAMTDGGPYMLPMFDMRINGSDSLPVQSRFACQQVPPSRIVRMVEDCVNEFKLGDAMYQPTRHFVDRVKFKDSGNQQINTIEMFPNVIARFGADDDVRYRFSMVSKDETQNFLENIGEYAIDYGVIEGSSDFEQRVHNVNRAIVRYANRMTDNDGTLRGVDDIVPGDIVAWVQVEVSRPEQKPVYIMAPVIPFALEKGNSQSAPAQFEMHGLSFSDTGDVITVDWANTASLERQYAKSHDGLGAANKGMFRFSNAIEDERLLSDGNKVDNFIYAASIASRRIGTDRRMKTMMTLLLEARLDGYNFARCEGAFPDNLTLSDGTPLKEAMLSDRNAVTKQEWKRLLDNKDFRMAQDHQMDVFLKYEAKKFLKNGNNPTDYLASEFVAEDGTRLNPYVIWEFNAMFDSGLNYENALLRWLHYMKPDYCPKSIDDTAEYKFRLLKDDNGNLGNGYDQGVLQRQVQHRDSNGDLYWLWENTYSGLSFFGEDYSGFSRPNVSGSSNLLDAANTMSYYGKRLSGTSERLKMQFTQDDLAAVEMFADMLGSIGKA